MKFDDLDAKMRRFEAAHDHCVLPGIFMVASSVTNSSRSLGGRFLACWNLRTPSLR